MLLKPIEAVRGHYDYIFIDFPPRVAPTTVPSMRVADYVVLCTIPEDAAVQYLVRTWKDIEEAREHGFDVKVLGILMSSIKRPMTRFARHLVGEVDQLQDEDGKSLKFDADISLGVAMSESQGMHQTLFQYEPAHTICEQYRAVAREMEARIKRSRGVELTPQPSASIPSAPQGEPEVKEVANG
jgi:cellulose biosynthesis protein BcsQ